MSKRVAMTAESKNGLQSLLDPRFGRAQAFLIIDLDSRGIIAELDNASVDSAHGAGTGAAATMSDHDVNVVISGRFGPKAAQALSQLGIEMRIAPAGVTADRALDMLAAGTLQHPPSDGSTETSVGGGMSQSGGRGMGGGGGRGMGGGGRMGRGGQAGSD
jgi:predicted Fe-Mo cluster-binding NifX family protein